MPIPQGEHTPSKIDFFLVVLYIINVIYVNTVGNFPLDVVQSVKPV